MHHDSDRKWLHCFAAPSELAMKSAGLQKEKRKKRERKRYRKMHLVHSLLLLCEKST